MKQNLNSKKRITGYIKEVLNAAKPLQPKIEKVLADNPTLQNWIERSAPWRRKIRASVIVNLNKARSTADAAKKEFQDLRRQCRAEPKKAFANTVAKAKSSWKKKMHNKPPTANAKTASSNGTKAEKRDSAAS